LFKLVTLEDTVRIPPDKFGQPIDQVASDQLKSKYEGMANENIGNFITVTDIHIDSVGKIIPGDGATYHKAQFTLLTFFPEIQEIIEGEVVEIEDFGAFVRIGPVDALLHVSQIINDFVHYDEKQSILLGKETQRSLRQGDKVRVRITAASQSKGGSGGKIGVTMRQPFLGKLEWIDEDVKNLKKSVKGAKEKAKEEKAEND
jgi:DNA-directed RNA polymerase subunit E'